MTTARMSLAPGLQRTTGPTVEPLSLAEAKDHCEIAASEKAHDGKLIDFIAAAREVVENDTQSSLLNQTFTLSLDEFPSDGNIWIPMKPLQSVSSITYYDEANAQQTLSSSVYGVNTARRLVFRDYNQSWPNHVVKSGGIVVTFVAGYGTYAANVPAILKHMIKLRVSHAFEHRGDELNVHGTGTYEAAYEKLKLRFLRSSYP